MSDRIPWRAGSLWQKLKARHEHALGTGALQPIDTKVEHLSEEGIQFVVRILANLERKEKALKQQNKTASSNPFLPYEQDLYTTDVSPTHLCLLNKFNVVDYHFLIITRQFEPQESWLTLSDFKALVRCLADVDGLAFFNGGTVAGSSQPHKHLQVVPYTPSLQAFPLESVINNACADSSEGICTAAALGFRHAIAPLKPFLSQQISQAEKAHHYLKTYRTLLNAVGINNTPKSESDQWKGEQTAAYNLLCTRHWMMIVPRTQEKSANISVNSLGFAGSLFVKNKESLEALKSVGPMTLLETVSGNPY